MRQQSGFAQAAQYAGQTTGVVKLFHKEAAGRLQINQCRCTAADFCPVLQFKRHPDTGRDRLQMDHGISRTADGSVDPDRIFECSACQDFRQPQIFPHHVDNPHARHVRQHITACIDCRNRGVVRQGSAQRLGHASHGGSRSHGVAGTGRA